MTHMDTNLHVLIGPWRFGRHEAGVHVVDGGRRASCDRANRWVECFGGELNQVHFKLVRGWASVGVVLGVPVPTAETSLYYCDVVYKYYTRIQYYYMNPTVPYIRS